MKIQSEAFYISFHQLRTLFDDTANLLQLKAHAGEVSVHVFDIEQGLQARLLKCVFKNGMEMFCDQKIDNKETYYTLAYFLNKEHLRFANNNTLFRDNIIWDILFISSNSLLRMYVPPATPVVCLNISFSKKWLNQHLCNSSKTHQQLNEAVFTAPSCAFLEYMNGDEKKLLLELIDASAKHETNTLHFKSAMLKMIADFFNKLKQKTTLCTIYYNMQDLLAEAERYLSSGVKGAMPNCKALAIKYGFSEVSLKRHFKQHHGINMSTYFMRKKMEYAQQLMKEANITKKAAARMLGYKNINHFVTTYQKFTSTNTSDAINA